MRGTHTGTYLFFWSSQHSPCAPLPPPPSTSDGVRAPPPQGLSSSQPRTHRALATPDAEDGGDTAPPARGSLEGTLVKVLLVWSMCGDVTECGAWGPPPRGEAAPLPLAAAQPWAPLRQRQQRKGTGLRRGERKRKGQWLVAEGGRPPTKDPRHLQPRPQTCDKPAFSARVPLLCRSPRWPSIC